MSKEAKYSDKAAGMYITQLATFRQIAKELGLSEKTVAGWAKKQGWEAKKEAYLSTKKSLDVELYELARDLTSQIKENFKATGEVSSSQLYALNKILAHLPKAQTYEQEKAPEKEEKKTITAETLAKIEELLL